MLKTRCPLGWVLVLVMLGAGTVPGAAAPAHAAPELDCPGGWSEEYVDSEGFTRIIVRCPEGVIDASEAGGGSGGGKERPAERECTYGLYTVECTTSAGTWNGTCYVKVADPQPGNDHPVWAGHEDGDGVIIQCTTYDGTRQDCDADGGCPPGVSLRWAAAAPSAGPSAAELARRAVAQMQLTMGEIGSTPPAGTTTSFVGLPIWLWVANPAPNTTGPLTVSVAEDGLSVTATAVLDRITYLMSGQGVPSLEVTCAGSSAPGTPYEATYGDASSPTCGITVAQNQHTGTYTITGTAYWSVGWSGGGQSGTIVVDVDNSIRMEVGEAQVVRVD